MARAKSTGRKKASTPKAAEKKTKAKAKSSAKKKPATKTPKRTRTPKKKKVVTTPKPVADKPPQQFEIELILDMRKNARKEEFLVSWVGYPEEDNTWELGRDLKADGHGKAVAAFKRELKKKKAAKAEQAEEDEEEDSSNGAKEEEVAATVASPSTPAKVSVTTVSDGNVGSHAPSTAGSYAFFWAVLLGSILLHFIVVILYEQADQSHGDFIAKGKWKNFLNQAKHWLGVLPPFMSLTVLVSHPAATAPFPKYVTVGLLWIATSTLLQNFNGLFGNEVQSMESIGVLVTFTNVISYIFFANGFSGIRSVSTEKAPASYVWGALWISMFAWEFTIRMENNEYGTIPANGSFIDNTKHLFLNGRVFSPNIENIGMLLSVAKLGSLYYATWSSSACVGHECSIYSHDAIPQHLGLIGMLFLVFANMWGILNFHLDKISWLSIQSINEQKWFDEELQNVIVWVGAGLLTTVGLMEADASN